MYGSDPAEGKHQSQRESSSLKSVVAATSSFHDQTQSSCSSLPRQRPVCGPAISDVAANGGTGSGQHLLPASPVQTPPTQVLLHRYVYYILRMDGILRIHAIIGLVRQAFTHM